jgi:hypothetical protein
MCTKVLCKNDLTKFIFLAVYIFIGIPAGVEDEIHNQLFK